MICSAGAICALAAIYAVYTTSRLRLWPGAPGLVSLAPFDLFADVRVIMTVAPGWLEFALLLSCALSLRVLLWSQLLHRLMSIGGESRGVEPGGRDRPAPPTSVRRLLAVLCGTYLLAIPFALAGAASDFACRATSYAQLCWTGAAASVTGSLAASTFLLVRLTQSRSRVECLRFSAAYLSAAVLVGTLGSAVGESGLALLVPAWTAVTLVAARRLTCPLHRHRRSRAPLVSGATGASALLIAAPLLASAIPAGVFDEPRAPAGQRPSRAASLFLVPGIGAGSGRSALHRLDPRHIGFTCGQTHYFSYAGPGRGATSGHSVCPIRSGAPHRAPDTLRPLDDLAGSLLAQIEPLPPPVVVVTHSHGAQVTLAALRGLRSATVSHIVMLSPFPMRPVELPRRGERGTGLVGAHATRALSAVGRHIGFTVYDPDSPLARDLPEMPLAAAEPRSTRLDASPDRGLDAELLVVTATLDAPLAPWDSWPRGIRVACPVPTTHTGLPTHPMAHRLMRDFLGGGEPSDCRLLRALAESTAFLSSPATLRSD